MPLTRRKKFALAALTAALLIAALAFARHYSEDSDASARWQLLESIPSDATAVIFLDLDEFRNSPFLARLHAWAPHLPLDSEYEQFVRDTGFSYERDLKRVVVAISSHGATTNLLAIADGTFDRKRIEAFLQRTGRVTQQGKRRVFLLAATAHDKPLSLAFLSDRRIVVSEAENLSGELSNPGNAGRAEWNSRFDRLAGTPLFAVVRQDPAIEAALASAAPGSFGSPQLSALLNELQWISIAGKPEGEQLRIVSEGECLSAAGSSQLRDFLQGVLMLAENGLNDPKLRQQMDREERDAYLEILKSADIQKIDRGEWKSVRLVLEITPKFLDVVRANSIAMQSRETRTPPEGLKKKPAVAKSKTAKKK